MKIKLWTERPPTPVVLAWMTAGVLFTIILAALGYAVYGFVAYLTN